MMNLESHEIPFSFEQPEAIQTPLLSLLQRIEQTELSMPGSIQGSVAQHVLVIDAVDSRARYIERVLFMARYRPVLVPKALDAFTLFLRGGYNPLAVIVGQDEANERFFLQRLLTQIEQRYDRKVPLIRLLVRQGPPSALRSQRTVPIPPRPGSSRGNSDSFHAISPAISLIRPQEPHGMPVQSSPILTPPSPSTPEPLFPQQMPFVTTDAMQLGTQEAAPLFTPSAPIPSRSGFENSQQLPQPKQIQPLSLEGQDLGRYRVRTLIGTNVYQTYDRLRERDIALKAYQTNAIPYAMMEGQLEESNIFELEAELLDPLKHPHILPVLNTGKSYISGVPFIYKTMPLCAEGSLKQWLWQRGENRMFSSQEILPILLQLADALQFVHNRQVTYQNFKLSNLLLRGQAESLDKMHILLADFAITQDGSFFSHSADAYPYIAPERWLGQTSPASDQYGLAAIIYELLTGRPLFQGTSEQTLKHLHMNMQPQPPSAFNPMVPAYVNSVLLKALAKDPQDRFPNVMAFAKTFQQYCSV